MPLRSSLRFPATAALLALACLGWSSPPPSAGEALAAAGKKDVTVTLKIADKTAGFSLEARKLVAADTNAFDFVRHTVAVAYRTDAEGGPVVTSLCGVSAPKGLRWTCYVDGEACKGGPGRVALTKDAVIEWKPEKADKAGEE
jgi:hypothetical protein